MITLHYITTCTSQVSGRPRGSTAFSTFEPPGDLSRVEACDEPVREPREADRSAGNEALPQRRAERVELDAEARGQVRGGDRRASLRRILGVVREEEGRGLMWLQMWLQVWLQMWLQMWLQPNTRSSP